MLVFGDTVQRADVRGAIVEISKSLHAIANTPSLIAHAARVAVFIEAAELAQGIADARFSASGVDAQSAEVAGITNVLMQLAALVQRSWESGFCTDVELIGKVDQAIESLSCCVSLPDTVSRRVSEGYAFYALYPELYLEAGKALAGKDPQVIGLRSIGFGLAALVAQSAGARPPLSLRPTGHPFHRVLSLAPKILADLSSASDYAIVDEGPGLSGSSFGAVIDCLETLGVTFSRMQVFPSHAGPPGGEAEPRLRARWQKVAKHHVGFDDLFLANRDDTRCLSNWASDLIGRPNEPIEDLSAGAWRRLNLPADESAWPPSYGFQERRKFRLRTRSGRWLLKFSGLGRYGADKLPRAQALSGAGFTPEVLGLRYGFLVERWIDAPCLDLRLISRRALIDCVSRYLGFRAKSFYSPEAGSGASLAELARMLNQNAGETCASAAGDIDRYARAAVRLESQVRRIVTDNRLQCWEWLMSPDGTIIKTDALDHAQTHDLIGCQDVAWDIAGAIVEFELDLSEADELVGRVGAQRSEAVNRKLLDFLLPCYSAFQLGLAATARQSLSSASADAARLRGTEERYRRVLEQQLSLRL